MKKFSKKIACFMLSLVMIITCEALPTTALASSQKTNVEYVEGEAIVVFKSNASNKLLSQSGISDEIGDDVVLKNSWTFADNSNTLKSSGSSLSDDLRIATYSSATLTTKQLVAKLSKNENVDYAIPNFIVKATSYSNDTYSDYQWALSNTGQNAGTAGCDVDADEVRDKASSSTGSDENVIAIVDTGIDYTNPEFADCLWENPYQPKLLGNYGYDLTGTISGGLPYDDDGHGTHVAGIIKAQADNALGISGIDNSNTKIMALKFLDASGNGTTEDAISAYDYIYRAICLGTNVVAINNSWGGYGTTSEQKLFDALFDKLGEYGAVSCVAAGNDGIDTSDNPYGDFLWDDEDEPIFSVPTNSDSAYEISVAATNEKDELASFSSYSTTYVDVAAPGANILSTVAYDCFNPTIYSSDEISNLCSYYESFDDDTYSSYIKTSSSNLTLAQSDTYFGTSGTSLSVTVPKETSSAQYYYMTVPFTIDDADAPYYYSFMFNGNSGNVTCAVYDVPYSTSISKLSSLDPIDYFSSYGSENYWSHLYGEVDPSDENTFYDYQKSTDRKLVFLFLADESASCALIDDLAISKSGVSSEAFGKYDFYNGTSMATPYVTGAISLIKAAYPDATASDLVNMVTKTGRYSASLEGKIKNPLVLSLDDVENIPPLITDAYYDDEDTIAITGSFRDIDEVKINSDVVTPISVDNNTILVPAEESYNANKISIEITNKMGTDSKDVLVVNKNTYDINENLYLDLGEGGFFMSTGDYIYYMSTYGDIQMIYYDYDLDCYTSMAVFQPDMSQVFDDIDGIEITAATYRNSKIYFIAVKDIYSSVDKLIGKETAFCSYDFNTDKTKYLCDIPNEMVEGYSLATYNGGVYLLGGYDASTKVGDYTTAFYKYTSDGFKQQNASLPSGRAYGECVQYYDKLVYMYGTSSSNTEIPSALVYDGKTWTQSAVKLSSEDCNEIEFNDGKKAYYYEGNLGVCDYGVFCSGAFVYGIGDTFIYDVDEDSVSGYDNVTFSTELDDIPLYGTTVDGAFVGATLDENTLESVGYQLGIDTAFPVLSFDYSNDNYYLSASSDNYTYAFGDSVTITATPANGYVVTAIYANGKKYTPSSKNSATIVINDDTYVYATVKKVAPNKVNDLKVSSTSASSVTLSWSKPARAVGYQVQEYKNKKWTTVKTIKSSDTTTCKLTGLSAGTHKYRVRAYSTYNSKTYYGDYSSTLSVYVPSKQAITSVKAGSASFTVAYKQNKNATGYQVQYSTSSKFTNATTKTVSKNTTTSYTASKLTAKKKYYVRVRSYKTVNGKKVYGAWSDAKNVTTK